MPIVDLRRAEVLQDGAPKVRNDLLLHKLAITLAGL
jgi:hypothetical protein